MENEKNLDYNIYKTISLFTPTCYLCLKHFLMETKLNSFALIFYRIFLEHPGTWTSMLGKNHTMQFEEQEEIVGKELSLCHEDSLISPFLNPYLLSHEVSYVELKLFLASSISHIKCKLLLPFAFKDVDSNLFFEGMSKKLFQKVKFYRRQGPREIDMKI
ncbi:hypothetical protein M9H77_30292 [Catharanthus roseus]|uniref:Uncharacterized protein n=1 Tax=Catharanthus roseus TaxID=4058 RepID=A0ACB9ZYP5_CATRO|nr:hypothetical protein M9H77_30292 [Catharanthus roseus]